MGFAHTTGIKPTASAIELGRGADGIVIEVLDHPELVIKDMNHPFRLGRNRRGTQASRNALIEVIFRIYPSADVNSLMLPDPTFDNVRWGYTESNPVPRWILIDP